VRLHEPVEVAALFDFGLTPRHLRNSAETLMKYEKDNPQTAPLLQAFAKALLNKPSARPAGQPEPLSYYKCNMNAIVGDGETIPWPLYTSRLDVEPELAVVYGNPRQPVADSASSTTSRPVTCRLRIHRWLLPDEGHGQGQPAWPLAGHAGRGRRSLQLAVV